MYYYSILVYITGSRAYLRGGFQYLPHGQEKIGFLVDYGT